MRGAGLHGLRAHRSPGEGRGGYGPTGGQWRHAVLREQERWLMEIHHRIKNDFQTLASLLAMRADALEDSRALAAHEDNQPHWMP
jgi:two-component sensor histidine kinase